MTEVIIDCGFLHMADLCDQYISPRKFYLHNRVGNEEWDVSPYYGNTNHQRTKIKLADPAKLTFILLKIK